MGWRDYDPTTGRFIVPDAYEGEEDEPTSLNRYLYAEGDPVNNIDPDGNKAKWLQAAWKSSKNGGKATYNALIGDDINTLKSDKSKWHQKAGAGISIASNFVPGIGQAGKVLKISAKAAKATKKKVAGKSLKNQKKAKVTSAQKKNTSKKSNVASTKGTGKTTKVVAGKITGYTKLGLEQAMQRDSGRGVSPKAILDSVRNPTKEVQQTDGRTKYMGKNAVVVLNKTGKVVTTYAKGTKGTRRK